VNKTFDLRDAAEAGQPAARMTAVAREGILFAVAAFLSASLLFSSEPMMGRMVAPLLGGAPAVWNTCLVFFQVILLLGYLYSHFVATRFSPRAQRVAQVVLLVVACLALPLGIPASARENVTAEAPIQWMLKTLLITVGLPFFALSTQAPLLQSWLGRRGRSPFFLYAASNVGSLLALLCYPIAVEPLLRMADQVVVWAVGFLVLIPLVWFAGKPVVAAVEETKEIGEAISWRRRFFWMALAFVPSSLLQGVTSYLSADIASLPLLWVIPLALYLLTFVIAFSESIRVSWQKLDWLLAVGAVCLVLLLAIEASQPAWLMMLMHLAFFTVASLFCHVRLSQHRPSPARLTEFYLWMAVGGAAGGLFNALVAPNVFSRIVEYPLAILLACLLRPGLWRGALVDRVKDISYPIAFAVLTAASALTLRALAREENVWASATFGGLALACFFMKNQPLRFALSLAAVLVGGSLAGSKRGHLLHVERNFFGVIRVTQNGPFYRLYHGTTVHGMQRAADPGRCEPMSYYYVGGGLNRMMELAEKSHGMTNVAVVGLGAGGAVTYAKAHQHWSIYEIDPAIIRIANDSPWFSFVKCTEHAPIDYFLGDARLLLAKAPAQKFDFMIMDAFSSDTVPMHLLTREAMRMYMEKLAPGGFIAFHVSSRNLKLEPVVANVAAAEGLDCYEPAYVRSPDDVERFSATWLLLVRKGEGPEVLRNRKEWIALAASEKAPIWTDDFLNLWSVIAF
jgi:hypothetical protein